jgi:dGTPase
LGREGFEHNQQSVRVVEVLENDGQGLNLTWEVREGIRWHTGEQLPSTLEARIVRISDRIAYINHDIDDALRAGLITVADLPVGPVRLLGQTGSDRIDTLVHDLVDTSFDLGDIAQSAEVGQAMDELRTFLFETVYARSLQQAGERQVRLLLTQLMEYFLEHPEALPTGPAGSGEGSFHEVDVVLSVTDYVAGMTDRYAERVYRELFLPKFWGSQ